MENHSEESDSLQAARNAIKKKAWEEAAGYCRQVLQSNRKNPEAHYLVGIITAELGHIGTAIKAFDESLTLAPENVQTRIQLARCLVHTGAHDSAKAQADRALAQSPQQARSLDLLGTVYSHIGLHEKALPLFQRAVELSSEVLLYQSNLAACALFLGNNQTARNALDKVLLQQPGDCRSHWQLARLNRTCDTEHIATMSALVAESTGEDAAYLHYALGKEYEDLQQWDKAWHHYHIAGNTRRLQVKYEPEDDRQLYRGLQATYDEGWFNRNARGYEGDTVPVFVVGMPRTGTTLIERILDNHSQIHSAGELQQFGIAVKQLTKARGPVTLDVQVAKAAGDMDLHALGKRYIESTQFLRENTRGDNTSFFVDKLPHNFLYLGLIAKALPRARFIHVCRNPMDTCFAVYKQLFAGAYPFSYKLEELADYYIDYYRLMAHWQTLLGERFLPITYETVVNDQENATRRLLEYLNLDMEPQCLTFYNNPRAVATASATQVREKLHSRSIGLWKHFKEGLLPLEMRLKQANIPF